MEIDEQFLTVVFNHPLIILIKVVFSINIGMGDFIVKSTYKDLAIINSFINDGH